MGRSAAYALLLIVVLVTRALSWHVSFVNVDEAAFIMAAREVLAGYLPYTTFFDVKPVGSSVLLALAMATLGQTLLAVRLFGTACVFAAGVAIYEIVRLSPAARRIDALGAAIIYSAFSVLFSGTATMTEIMVAPFTCAGVLLLCRTVLRPAGRRGAAWRMLGAGFAFGLAVWIRTVPIVPGTALGATVLLQGLFTRRITPAGCVALGGVFAIGMLAPTAATAMVYAATGHFGEFAYSNFGFMRVYVEPAALTTIVLHLMTIASQLWPLALLAGPGLWLDARQRRAIGPFPALLYVWLGAETVACVASLRVYDHYFLMMLPPLAVLAARALGGCVRALADTPAGFRACAGAIIAVALVPVVPTIRANALSVLKFPDMQRTTSDAIAALLPPDDRSLLVLGRDFMVDYLYTGTPLPGRVAFVPLLFGNEAGLVGGDPTVTLGRVLDRNPRIILVDYTAMQAETPVALQDAVRRKLACCYRDAVAMGAVWHVDQGGIYHVSDVHLFERRDAVPR